MDLPILFADFNNPDREGRLRLNCDGTIKDIERIGLMLHEGMLISLDDTDGLSTEGIVELSLEENIWVAKIDWTLLNKM